MLLAVAIVSEVGIVKHRPLLTSAAQLPGARQLKKEARENNTQTVAKTDASTKVKSLEDCQSLKRQAECAGMGVGTQITPKKRPADGERTLWAVVSLTEEEASLKTVGLLKRHKT